MSRVEQLVAALGLHPHPEGGYFREVYRSAAAIRDDAPRLGFPGERSCATSIYFLLPGSSFSAFHRIRSDEGWHWYEGAPVEIFAIGEDGEVETLRLGPPETDGQYQATVPAGRWFAARCVEAAGYALVGCTVAPGFDFADFELADRETLARRFPRHRTLIESFTRSG